jgi:MFS family permease
MAILATMTVAATALWSSNWPVWLFSVPAFLLGFLGIGWNALALVFVAELSGASKAGTAVGLSSAISWLGLAVGTPVFGYIVTLSSYFYGWFFVAGMYFVATLLCISMTFLTKQR